MIDAFIATPKIQKPIQITEIKTNINLARARVLIRSLEHQVFDYIIKKASTGECINPRELTDIFYFARKEMENL